MHLLQIYPRFSSGTVRRNVGVLVVVISSWLVHNGAVVRSVRGLPVAQAISG